MKVALTQCINVYKLNLYGMTYCLRKQSWALSLINVFVVLVNSVFISNKLNVAINCQIWCYGCITGHLTSVPDPRATYFTFTVPYVAQSSVGTSYRHIGMQLPANSERMYRLLDCKIIHCMQLLDKFPALWIYYVLRRNYKTPPLGTFSNELWIQWISSPPIPLRTSSVLSPLVCFVSS